MSEIYGRGSKLGSLIRTTFALYTYYLLSYCKPLNKFYLIMPE